MPKYEHGVVGFAGVVAADSVSCCVVDTCKVAVPDHSGVAETHSILAGCLSQVCAQTPIERVEFLEVAVSVVIREAFLLESCCESWGDIGIGGNANKARRNKTINPRLDQYLLCGLLGVGECFEEDEGQRCLHTPRKSALIS
jgi:hypothetical protein